MPVVMVCPSTQLPPLIRTQINDFMRVEAWQVYRDKPAGWDFMVPETEPVSAVLVEGQVVLSHALVTRRPLAHAGQTWNTYGLSAVFTYPEARGRGYGRQVVQAASEFIRTGPGDIAMLRCRPHLKPFYGACGWEAVDELVVLEGDPERPTAEGRIMMLLLSERARRERTVFERGQVYVGAYMW